VVQFILHGLSGFMPAMISRRGWRTIFGTTRRRPLRHKGTPGDIGLVIRVSSMVAAKFFLKMGQRVASNRAFLNNGDLTNFAGCVQPSNTPKPSNSLIADFEWRSLASPCATLTNTILICTDNGISHARISETVLSNRRARSRSVMVLRNSPSRCDTVSAALSIDRNLPIWVEPCVTPNQAAAPSLLRC